MRNFDSSLVLSENGKTLLQIPSNVVELEIPEGVRVVLADVFKNCNDLVSVTFPSTLYSVPEFSFRNCPNLRHAIVPSGNILPYAFAFTENLETIELGPNVKSIGEGAFRKSGLPQVKIPSGASLEKACFRDCVNLEYVELESGINFIPESMFCGCDSLRDIDIPFSVWAIEDAAFAFTGLEEVFLPETINLIGTHAFAYCKHLRHLSIPRGVEIGEGIIAGSKRAKVELREDYPMK